MSNGKVKDVGKRRMGIKAFVFCSAMCVFAFLLNISYVVGTTRMVEKQFGLTARHSGILDGMDNAVAVPMQLVCGYIGDRWSKPKLISMGAFLMAISNFVATMPHFVLDPPKPGENDVTSFSSPSPNDSYVSSIPLRIDVMCRGESFQNESCPQKTSGNALGGPSIGEKAFYILLMSRAIYGMGSAPQVSLTYAYIYENSDHHKSALYIGILNSVFALGPVVGYMLSGYTNRLPVDLKDFSLSPSDPRFIGCWWLGFAIIGCIGLVGCVPVFTFPDRLKPLEGKDSKKRKEAGLKGYIKEFLHTLKGLVWNPLYMSYALAKVSLCYVVIMFIKVLPRYLEFHFRLPVYKTNLISGGAFTVPAVIGSFIGGLLISRFKMRDVTVARMMMCLLAIGAGLVGVMMTFRCPQVEYAGTRYDVTTVRANISTTCSVSCGCDVSSSQPVCGSDGRDYFTPCHAGCTNITMTGQNANFTNCKCLSGGWAVPGTCQSTCQTVIPYIVTKSVASFCAALINTPFRILLIRAVPAATKAFGIAFLACLYNLLGFLPGPILSGTLIDRSCLIWQRKCGRRGSCLLYDVILLRNYTHGGAIFCTLLACLLSTVGWLIHRKKEQTQTGEKDQGQGEKVNGYTVDVKEKDSLIVNGISDSSGNVLKETVEGDEKGPDTCSEKELEKV